MRVLRDLPIRRKLLIIVMFTTTIALLLSGIGVLFIDSILFRSYLDRDLSALGQIIADNSTAALAFHDPESAAETLGALKVRSHLIAACIYQPDATIFASYSRPTGPSVCPPAPSRDETRFAGNTLTVSRAIVLTGRRIGTLVLQYDLGEVYERRAIYGSTVLIVLLASSVIAFALASSLRSVITTPISQLVRVTTLVSATTDYSIRAHRLSGDELGVLVDRFNEMLAAVQTRDTNLNKALIDREEALRAAEEARERFHFMAESMPQKIFTARPNGDTDYFNGQWSEFTGLSIEQVMNFGWMRIIHSDDVEANIQLWRQSIETGNPFHFQHRFRRFDGTYRWHLSRAHAMRDVNGNISMWIGSSTDIHEQKEQEEELRRANDDLQQFAYAASHDLQEPVRNVAVYSEIISRRYQSQLDADGRQFLEFLTEGGRRLATLINDLLAYTRAGVIEGQVQAVDASGVLKDTLFSLAEAIRESGATVTYDDLPNVNMGATHLQQVFLNLIGNALRYRGDQPPQIHISVTGQGPFWRFAVQDNGIGIASQHKEKIFGVFKRLHHDRKYSGTGIGLAICQRVVERYGGRIWVESEPGKGSTFHFTVPKPARRVHLGEIEPTVG